jgi:hypothetical protein
LLLSEGCVFSSKVMYSPACVFCFTTGKLCMPLLGSLRCDLFPLLNGLAVWNLSFEFWPNPLVKFALKVALMTWPVSAAQMRQSLLQSGNILGKGLA